jgi:hypothetical protein
MNMHNYILKRGAWVSHRLHNPHTGNQGYIIFGIFMEKNSTDDKEE